MPNFNHLYRMTVDRGTFEHAQFNEPRISHGYCTDDMARVLIVASRQPFPTPATCYLEELSLRFLIDAQGTNGGYRNRMDRRGHWKDQPTFEDCWGRSIQGLGTAAAHSTQAWLREAASAQLDRALSQRSGWSRATAFAVLGAAELLSIAPHHRAALGLIIDAADAMPTFARSADWPWPEARLRYANATLAEAMIAAGTALERPRLCHHGLELLAWLFDHETLNGHLSVTPVGGAGPGDTKPAFDQQPIEVAALADACARASTVDDNRLWDDGVSSAAAWFLGANDGGIVMWDEETGGGYDGLHRAGANLNQGTESTLALLSTLQHANRLVAASL
jgi:hypothetical protein